MYNPRNYAISIERILGTPQYLTGEIEKNPISFLSSFLDAKYESDESKIELINAFDEKFSKYKNVPLCNWDEKDAKQLIDDLRKIF